MLEVSPITRVKTEEREQIEKDVQAFIDAGGEIKKEPIRISEACFKSEVKETEHERKCKRIYKQIERNPGITSKQIAENLDLDRGAVTKLLFKMLNSDYNIKSEVSPKHKSIKLWYIK